MTQAEFDKVLEMRIASMREVLAGKAEEYRAGGAAACRRQGAGGAEVMAVANSDELRGMLK